VVISLAILRLSWDLATRSTGHGEGLLLDIGGLGLSDPGKLICPGLVPSVFLSEIKSKTAFA
jgi:hypothetical protein